jgi:hypothetical protein
MISKRLVVGLSRHETDELKKDYDLDIKDGYIICVLTKEEYEILLDINNYYDKVKQQEYINRMKGK